MDDEGDEAGGAATTRLTVPLSAHLARGLNEAATCGLLQCVRDQMTAKGSSLLCVQRCVQLFRNVHPLLTRQYLGTLVAGLQPEIWLLLLTLNEQDVRAVCRGDIDQLIIGCGVLLQRVIGTQADALVEQFYLKLSTHWCATSAPLNKQLIGVEIAAELVELVSDEHSWLTSRDLAPWLTQLVEDILQARDMNVTRAVALAPKLPPLIRFLDSTDQLSEQILTHTCSCLTESHAAVAQAVCTMMEPLIGSLSDKSIRFVCESLEPQHRNPSIDLVRLMAGLTRQLPLPAAETWLMGNTGAMLETLWNVAFGEGNSEDSASQEASNSIKQIAADHCDIQLLVKMAASCVEMLCSHSHVAKALDMLCALGANDDVMASVCVVNEFCRILISAGGEAQSFLLKLKLLDKLRQLPEPLLLEASDLLWLWSRQAGMALLCIATRDSDSCVQGMTLSSSMLCVIGLWHCCLVCLRSCRRLCSNRCSASWSWALSQLLHMAASKAM